jgi:LysM repeat protein
MQIKRKGRHTTPSQVEKVAEKAGKAAPAMAIAGVLVAVPHTHHASAIAKPAVSATAYIEKSAASGFADTAAKTTATTTAQTTVKTTAKTTAATTHRTYDVQSGDTLSSIAQKYYHDAKDWQWLYHENDKTLSDPNLIYPGQDLYVPYDPPANYTLPDYTPKHAATTTTTTAASTPASSTPASSTSTDSSSSNDSTTTTAAASSTSLSGTLSCSGLEQLWESAGGSSGEAFIAAEIAIAESGGNEYATNPSSDTKGYWQISPVWGSESSYDPLTNAKAAVSISDDGTDWSAWTTYTSGAYEGRC